MLMECTCSDRARRELCEVVGLSTAELFDRVDLEFREVPYFLVSRSQSRWVPDAPTAVSPFVILRALKDGLVVDPDSEKDNEDSGARRTLIPWSNIITLTVSRSMQPTTGKTEGQE